MVDLESGNSKLVFEWDESNISLDGRGGERGLRGLVQYNSRVYVCSCFDVLEYNSNFELIGKYTCPYMYNLHDVWLDGDILYITTTGYDAVVQFDLKTKKFTIAVKFRKLIPKSFADRILLKLFPYKKYAVGEFNPTAPNGPDLNDTVHINSVSVFKGEIFVSGTGLDGIYKINARSYTKVFNLPTHTHNGQVHQEFIVYNRTPTNKVVLQNKTTSTQNIFEIPNVTADNSPNANDKIAKAGFNRGLLIHEDLLIVGSSPANINVFNINNGVLIRQVILSRDIKNAVHGICFYQQ